MTKQQRDNGSSFGLLAEDMIPSIDPSILSSERIKFVEAKAPDMSAVARLLEVCATANQWSNFGPLYDRLAYDYADHMGLASGLTLSPCANGGIGLEMLARAQAADAGQDKLRWVGSAFSFKNLGRGYFADIHFLDCDTSGLLSLQALEALPRDSYDGIIVTNPFGLCTDFAPYIRFAQSTGKKLLIDNAAGVGPNIPDWPWQSFSLHHTKPYGAGEGGMVLSPESAAEFLRLLINYDRIPERPEYWLNNGKISDISCAFLLDRLGRLPQWQTGYLEQRARVVEVFASFDLPPLLPVRGAPLTNSIPVLLAGVVQDAHVFDTPRVDITRQYQPLAPLPNTEAIYRQIINFPTHPDLDQLSDAELTDEIGALLAHAS